MRLYSTFIQVSKILCTFLSKMYQTCEIAKTWWDIPLIHSNICNYQKQTLYFKTWFNFHYPISDIAHNALQRQWGNFPFANWNGICWGHPLQLVQLMKIHFLPHLESFMWERKFEKKFFKKSYIQTPNVMLLTFKLPFFNGSYRN